MQTTPSSSCRLSRFRRAERAPTATKNSGTFRRNAAHMSVQMLSPRGPTTSSSEQNLDGEPSWNAGGLQAPTVDDDPTSQSDAVVSSKLTFRFAKPDPHEFVMRSNYGPRSVELRLPTERRKCSLAAYRRDIPRAGPQCAVPFVPRSLRLPVTSSLNEISSNAVARDAPDTARALQSPRPSGSTRHPPSPPPLPRPPP